MMLAEDLRRFQAAGEPILARRTSLAERVAMVPPQSGPGRLDDRRGAVAAHGDDRLVDRGALDGRVASRAEQARQNAERILSDMQTAQGLMAGERGRAAEAMLWFAHASRLAPTIPIAPGQPPAGASLEPPGQSAPPCPAARGRALKTLAFRPGGEHIMTLTENGQCKVSDVERGEPLPWTQGGPRLPRPGHPTGHGWPAPNRRRRCDSRDALRRGGPATSGGWDALGPGVQPRWTVPGPGR